MLAINYDHSLLAAPDTEYNGNNVYIVQSMEKHCKIIKKCNTATCISHLSHAYEKIEFLEPLKQNIYKKTINQSVSMTNCKSTHPDNIYVSMINKEVFIKIAQP